MLNNRLFLIIGIVIPLIVALIIGGVFLFRNDEPDEPDNTDPTDTIDTNDDIHHTVGDPVIEFDEGNEIYLDESLLPYLERMDQGVPAIDENGNYYLYDDGDLVYDYSGEKKLEAVLDNLILLINHFAKEEYSMDAMHQIQRFYVEYHDRFEDVEFADLAANIAKCFPKGGADPETLNQTVIEVFGYNRGDECLFVFSPMAVAPIKVEFYNVLPKTAELTESMEMLCIYDSWKNEEDDGYERNLEAWLHNVIATAKAHSLDDESVVVAQILYAGSLADAEYRPDWAEALIRCMTIENMSFDNLKLIVENEFGVCIDYNVPLIEYFAAKNAEVIE